MEKGDIVITPHKLADEAAQRDNLLYAPDERVVSPPKRLVTKDITSALDQLPPSKRESITEDNSAFLLFALTRSDEWGIPLEVEKYQLLEVLNQSDPLHRNWNQNLTREGKTIEKSLFETRVGIVNELAQDYLLSSQVIYGNEFYYRVLDFGGPRFCNPEENTKLLMTRAENTESMSRLSSLRPPRNPKVWNETIIQTVDLSKTLPLSLPWNTYTPQEIRTISEMFMELEETLENSNLQLQQPVHRKVPDSVYKIPYDPSRDVVDRYHFCLKLAKSLTLNGSPSSQAILDLQPLFITDLKEWVGQNPNRLEEFIDWVSGGGDNLPPKWFFEKTNGHTSKQKETANYLPNFLDSLPQPVIPTRVIYSSDPGCIPAHLTQEQLDEGLKNGDFQEIDLVDLNNFNEKMYNIFGNPKDNNHKGQRVANAIWTTTQIPSPQLLRTPHPDEPEIRHLRKYDAAKQRMGVYGTQITDSDGKRVLVLTALHKKVTRD